MGWCSAFGCSNNEKTSVMHRFPSDNAFNHDRRKKWINHCRRKEKDGKPWKPSKSAVLCDVSSYFTFF